MKLTQFIPITELGDSSSKPFHFEPKFGNTHYGRSLIFKDDSGDIITVAFGFFAYKGNIEISKTQKVYVPQRTYSVGFIINNVGPNDYEDDNAKAKKTDLVYYNRLLTTIKEILLEFIKQYNPNCLIAGKFDTGIENRQKNTRYEMYSRLFKNNVPAGYEYVELDNKIVTGIIKPEYRTQLYLKDANDPN